MKCQFKLLRMAVALLCSEYQGEGRWGWGVQDHREAPALAFREPVVNQKRWGVSVMCPKQGHPEKVFLFTLLDPSRPFVLLFKTVSCVAHVGIELAK